MKSLLTVLSVFATLSIAACGKGGGGADPGPVPPGVHPMSYCQVGQIYVEQYGCLNQMSCQDSHGYVQEQNLCVPGIRVTEQHVPADPQASNGRFFGALSIAKRSQFELLLRYSGLCDPYWSGWNWGQADCSYWSDRGYIEVNAISGPGHINLTIGAGTSYPYNPGGWGGTTPHKSFNQLAKAYDYNNGAGMQIVGADFNGNDVGLRAIVDNGRLSSSTLNLKLYFQGVHFANATVQRY